MNFFKKLFSFGKKPAKDLDKNEIDDSDKIIYEEYHHEEIKEEEEEIRSVHTIYYYYTSILSF